MRHFEAEEQFVELLDGTLSTTDEEALKAHLSQCERCREALNQYRATIALASGLASRTAELSPDFSEKLALRLKEPSAEQAPERTRPRWRRFRRAMLPLSTVLAASVAIVIAHNEGDYGKAVLQRLMLESAPPAPEMSAAALAPSTPANSGDAASSGGQPPMVEVLYAVQHIEAGSRLEAFMFDSQLVPADRIPAGAILGRDKQLLIGKFAKTPLNANLPVISEYITEVRPISALNIPPGYRALTISVDSRSGVEGFAKPNSRVDILWSYTDRQGEKAVATISRFIKVLTVAGMVDDSKTPSDGSSTATLLVPEREAKKIELARSLGTLSLTLVGQEEPDKLAGDAPEPVDIDSILGTTGRVVKDEPNDGVMYTTDTKSGKQLRYVLKSGRWKRDENEISSSTTPEQPQTAPLEPVSIEVDASTVSGLAGGALVKVLLKWSAEGTDRFSEIASKVRLVSISQLGNGRASALVLLTHEAAAQVKQAKSQGREILLVAEGGHDATVPPELRSNGVR